MPAIAETRDTVEALAAAKYKYGFTTDIAMEEFPKGLNEDIVRLISEKKERAGMDARLAAESLCHLAQHGRAELGAGEVSRH